MPPLAFPGTEWVRPRPDRRGYRADVILAALVLGGAAISTVLYATAGFYDDPAPIWVGIVCLVALCAPLALRRRFPEAVALVIAAAVIVLVTVQVPELLIYNIALFIAIYTVGAWGRSRLRAVIVRALIVLAMFTWLFIALAQQAADPSLGFARTGAFSPAVAFGLLQIFTNLLYFAGAYYFGDRAWAAARERHALEARTRELAEERQRSADQAITLERVRIARELHDVVAHHVAVMGIQAGAARRVLDVDPEQAKSALGSIESSARTAVDELHRLLTTLRDDAAGDVPSTSGVEQLPALIDDVAGAGVDIRYSTIGSPVALAPTTNATAYRVVQEAVTNAAKHAGPRASVDVRLRYLDGAIEVEIADDGVGARPGASSTGGVGLIGMRERVAAVDGRLEHGPRSRGGYLVRAWLPVTAGEPARQPTDAAAEATA